MLTVTATFDLAILYFVAANLVVILSYVLVLKHRARAIPRNLTVISKAVVDYFRENGNEVSVECICRADRRKFAALVTSKPSKRFRNSQLIEIVLATHVRKVCGLELEKVYWCFPIRTEQDAAQREAAPGDAPATVKGNDKYFDGDASNAAKLPGYRVRELSRKKYDELAYKQSANYGVATGD